MATNNQFISGKINAASGELKRALHNMDMITRYLDGQSDLADDAIDCGNHISEAMEILKYMQMAFSDDDG